MINQSVAKTEGTAPRKLSELYPKYYKELPKWVEPTEVDTYVINKMFPVDDPTGCILHARKKLLIPGVRSGGKSMLKDITEARDTLNRYIALMSPEAEPKEDQPSPKQQLWVAWNRFMTDINLLRLGLRPDSIIDVLLDGGTVLKSKKASTVFWDPNKLVDRVHILAWRLN